MAKLDRTPCPGFQKKPGEDFDRWHERTKGLMEQMEDISARKDPTTTVLKDAVVRFQVADGYAVYVVTQDDPLTLQHVPFMDGYQADAATIRGVNRSTVRDQLRRAAAFHGLEDRTTRFYRSLQIGSTVHYHNGFGTWVRCTVVANAEPGHNKSGRALKPVALVGDWKPYDLPKRCPDGSITEPFHVKQIREGDPWTPNEGFIFESPDFAHRSHFPDPSKLQPIDLSVPPMDAEATRRAELWQRINRIRKITEDGSRTPESILEDVRSAAGAP